MKEDSIEYKYIYIYIYIYILYIYIYIYIVVYINSIEGKQKWLRGRDKRLVDD